MASRREHKFDGCESENLSGWGSGLNLLVAQSLLTFKKLFFLFVHKTYSQKREMNLVKKKEGTCQYKSGTSENKRWTKKTTKTLINVFLIFIIPIYIDHEMIKPVVFIKKNIYANRRHFVNSSCNLCTTTGFENNSEIYYL